MCLLVFTPSFCWYLLCLAMEGWPSWVVLSLSYLQVFTGLAQSNFVELDQRVITKADRHQLTIWWNDNLKLYRLHWMPFHYSAVSLYVFVPSRLRWINPSSLSWDSQDFSSRRNLCHEAVEKSEKSRLAKSRLWNTNEQFASSGFRLPAILLSGHATSAVPGLHFTPINGHIADNCYVALTAQSTSVI